MGISLVSICKNPSASGWIINIWMFLIPVLSVCQNEESVKPERIITTFLEDFYGKSPNGSLVHLESGSKARILSMLPFLKSDTVGVDSKTPKFEVLKNKNLPDDAFSSYWYVLLDDADTVQCSIDKKSGLVIIEPVNFLRLVPDNRVLNHMFHKLLETHLGKVEKPNDDSKKLVKSYLELLEGKGGITGENSALYAEYYSKVTWGNVPYNDGVILKYINKALVSGYMSDLFLEFLSLHLIIFDREDMFVSICKDESLKNNSQASFRLAEHYEHIVGIGDKSVGVNDFIHYYLKAAEQGYTYSYYKLAEIYNGYRGFVKEDQKKRMEYLLKGAEGGNSLCNNDLGYIYLKKNRYGLAKEYFEKSVASGFCEAYKGLAVIYRYGYGVGKDLKKAEEYEKLAGKIRNCN